MFFLTEIDAMIRGVPGGEVEASLSEDIYIPAKSLIFLQQPGDHVFRGHLRKSWFMDGVPAWLKFKNTYQNMNLHAPIFLVIPTMHPVFLVSDIETFVHNNNNPNIQGYKCYIKTANEGIYKADLNQYIPVSQEINRPPKTSIYVHVPEHNLIYAGELQPLAEQLAPTWIPK